MKDNKEILETWIAIRNEALRDASPATEIAINQALKTDEVKTAHDYRKHDGLADGKFETGEKIIGDRLVEVFGVISHQSREYIPGQNPWKVTESDNEVKVNKPYKKLQKFVKK
ncbi:hypothetical protein NPX79_00300 [Spiroplasma endosymbiont of Anurida maritima]|uniref:hypothetical protein n=1 Tax=Spiroplasma endosymbiont of Anurida maritima TaxID=2967972 RepID=UPI0036D43FBA